MKERSTTLNFSSTGGGGLTKAVTAVQTGVPWFCTIGMNSRNDFDGGENKWRVNWLVIPAAPPSIDASGNITQILYLPREWFPRDATGQDFQTQQYFDISLIVHKSLIQENGDPIVEIDGNEKQLGKTTVGDYFHYSAFSLDNDWLITPSTQEKQVLISVDGGGQYQLIYNIQVE